MDKPKLRLRMKTLRSTMSDDEARVKSQRIASRLRTILGWSEISRMHVYRSNRAWHEVDTSWLEAYVSMMWPRIDLIVGDVSRSASLPEGSFDVIIVPFLAFDERRNRLGFGGGWYDRFLENQPSAISIGLGYEFQRVSQLAVEPHDRKLTAVITETSIY